MTGAAPGSSWLLTPRPLPAARWRLICLPHAGAGASTYFAWGAALQPAGIEVRSVQYPGRENRFSEPRIDTAESMVAALAAQWPVISAGGPCAIYGHSMGALLGFELAIALSRSGAKNQPRHLFLSGHNPPHLRSRLPTLHHLPEPEFVRAVALNYGNLPPELANEPEVMAMLSPILRSDFKLVDGYTWRGAGPVSTPMTILGGTADPWTTEAELREWARHTTGEFRLRMIEGDHFFVQKARAGTIAEVAADLAHPV